MDSAQPSTLTNGSSEGGSAVYTDPSKDVPWYNSSPPTISPSMSALLSTYAHIPLEQQVSHVTAIREQAYAIHPYPCLGLWAFLRLHLQNSPLFASVVEELKTDPQALFIDLGSGLGQEVRSLLAAGVPIERVRGVELEPAFNELGCKMFNDANSGGSCFVTSDILLDSGVGSLEQFYARASVLHAASFLHLWDWDGQIDVACRMVRLMQDRTGVRMLGRQIGSVVAKAKVHETNKNGATMWKHDPESFVRMWEIVGQKTMTKWKVTAELGKPYVRLDERTGQWWHDPDTRTIIWNVVRME